MAFMNATAKDTSTFLDTDAEKHISDTAAISIILKTSGLAVSVRPHTPSSSAADAVVCTKATAT
jgi:hypothetical protein